MAAKRDEIVRFCQQYLKTEAFPDHCHNGLQVEGSASVTRILTGVSYSVRLVEVAIKQKASMVLVHHGIFGNAFGDNPAITGFQRARLALLLKHDISLCGFHLPLDAHPKIGNNISLCRLLGVKKPEKLNVGFVGDLKTPEPSNNSCGKSTQSSSRNRRS
jgi:putative NIF3 family GTP cyclohydrolase 1 type 2